MTCRMCLTLAWAPGCKFSDETLQENLKRRPLLRRIAGCAGIEQVRLPAAELIQQAVKDARDEGRS
jgi:hypothetical protein